MTKLCLGFAVGFWCGWVCVVVSVMTKFCKSCVWVLDWVCGVARFWWSCGLCGNFGWFGSLGYDVVGGGVAMV